MYSTSTKLFDLPEELILIATEYLTGFSLKAFSTTCRCAYRIALPFLQKEKRVYELQFLRLWKDHTSKKTRQEYRERLDPDKIVKYNELLFASQNGDIRLVSRLLDQGVSARPPYRQPPKARDDDWPFYTPLVAAVHSNQAEIVKRLLAAGAVIPTRHDHVGHLVCQGSPDETTIGLLLTRGLNLNDRRRGSTHALHWACKRGAPLSIMEFLITSCEDVNALDYSGNSPLSRLIRNTHGLTFTERSAVIRMLIDNGVDIGAPCDIKGSFPLHVAVERETNAEMVRLLLEDFTADPNALDVMGELPLGRAVSDTSGVTIPKLLLEAGAGIDLATLEKAIAVESPSLPILYDAWVSQFGIDKVGLLLVASATMGDMQKIGHLFASLKEGDYSPAGYNVGLAMNKAKDEDTLDYLLSLVLKTDEINIRRVFTQAGVGADHRCIPVDQPQAKGCARLAEAALRGSAATMDTVLNAICDVIHSRDTRATLSVVIRSRHLYAVNLVLNRVKPMAGTSYTLLCEAIDTDDTRILQTVVDRDPTMLDHRSGYDETALSYAALQNKPEMVEVLLKAGANLNEAIINRPMPSPSFQEKQPLILFAALHGYADIVQILLAHGSDVNSTDTDLKRSLLSWASGNGHTNVAKVLLAHKADPALIDSYDMDALAWAARNNHAAIVMLLLAHGSKINREDDPNRNALRYAVSSGNLSMTRLLLTAGAIVPTGCPRNSELTVFCSAITAGLTGWQPVRSRHDNSTRFYRNRAPPHDKISVEEFDKRVQDRADLGRLLLEHGATIEDSFPGHLRGYEYAIHCNAAPVLEIYLDRGAVAIDQVNFQGMTPLLLAVRRNAHAVARMLVSRGADFLKPDYEGKTPLEYAQDDAMIGILYAGVGV